MAKYCMAGARLWSNSHLALFNLLEVCFTILLKVTYLLYSALALLLYHAI